MLPDHPNCKKPVKPETPTKPETPKTPEKEDPFKEWDKLIDSALETDSDGDGIPDALEKNGYTISEVFDQDGGYFHVMPWLETYDHNPEFYKHHPKYISNPFDKNTVGDPYTDLEKAGHSIYIEGSILPEAYHPLVAACPSVAIFMEEFILKEWKEVENTYTTGYSYHTSYGFEETRTSVSGTDEAKGGKLEFGGKGSAKRGEKPQVSGSLQGGVHLSTNLKHHTNEQQRVTTISSLQESNQQSKESSTTLHSASAAILQGIVRYRNMGTAKISNVRPTLNFSVADLPLSTYKVPEVAKLGPGDSYPAFGATGVIVTPSDSFQGHPSTISTDAKNKLAAGNPLKVATTQIQGTFTAAPGSGKYKPGTSIDWSDVTDTMMNRTARLLLETPNETLDRRVAAPSADEVVDTPDKTKPESGIPRVTVEQALQFAFGALPDNRGNLMVTTPQGFTYRIDRSHVTLYVDQKTDDLIAKQLQVFKDKGDETKSVYDVILTKEMVILIKPIIEVHAFVSNTYLYIENQFDQSLSYSVWKNTGTSSELLKQGIVPSASTIGTGYFCGNPAEELSIMVSRQVSQVIFEGTVSGLENRTQQFNTKISAESPAPTGDYVITKEKIYETTIEHDGYQVSSEVNIGYNQYYFNEISITTKESLDNVIACESDKVFDNQFFIQVVTTFKPYDNYLYGATHSYPPIIVELDGESLEKKNRGDAACGKRWTDQRANFIIMDNEPHKLEIKQREDSKVLHTSVYSLNPLLNKMDIKLSPFQNVDPTMIAVYKDSNGNICIKNKKIQKYPSLL